MKLALGTVQFGLDYGINNDKGRVSAEEVEDILTLAEDYEIDTLDTSAAYGESEAILGKVMEGEPFDIITKVPKGVDVRKSVLDSLTKLHREEVKGVLLHHFEAYKENPAIWEEFVKLKREGLTEKIGFSLYHPEEAVLLLGHGIEFDIVQVPYSIFDQRFSEAFDTLKREGIEIHVRSVFLQGLVFKDPEGLKGHFVKLKPKLELLNDIAEDLQTSISSVCINFALLNPLIDKVIIGVDSVENLKEDLKAKEEQDKIDIVYQDLKKLRENDENIIIPSNW